MFIGLFLGKAGNKTLALSSVEAEYMAISEAAKEAIHLKNLVFID